jgi:hypothetical protein
VKVNAGMSQVPLKVRGRTLELTGALGYCDHLCNRQPQAVPGLGAPLRGPRQLLTHDRPPGSDSGGRVRPGSAFPLCSAVFWGWGCCWSADTPGPDDRLDSSGFPSQSE